MDVDGRLGHIVVMFKFIYLFFFSCRFDVHVLLFWVYFFILGLMLLMGYLFLIFFYLIKINKLIFLNLDADIVFFNIKIDFLIIILMCCQSCQLFLLIK